MNKIKKFQIDGGIKGYYTARFKDKLSWVYYNHVKQNYDKIIFTKRERAISYFHNYLKNYSFFFLKLHLPNF